jgi:micrococcal nuclease
MLDLLIALLWQLFSGVVSNDTGEPAVFATTTAQVVRVVDGDTIVVRLNGREERVRYIGIDTPEVYADGEPACYAEEATAANRVLTKSGVVALVRDQQDRDDYGRLLRYVYADDTFINEALAQAGYARTLSIPPNTTHATVLADAVAEARAAQAGLWGVCN